MTNKNKKYICFKPTLSIILYFGINLIFSKDFKILYFRENWIAKVLKTKKMKQVSFSFEKITERFSVDNRVNKIIEENSKNIDDFFVANLTDANIGLKVELLQNVIRKIISEEISHYLYFLEISKRYQIHQSNLLLDNRLKKTKHLLNLITNSKNKSNLFFFITLEKIIAKFMIVLIYLNLLKNFLIHRAPNPKLEFKYILRAYNAGFSLDTYPKLDWMIDSKTFENEDILVLKEDRLNENFNKDLSNKYKNIEARRFNYIWTGGKKDFFIFFFNSSKLVLSLLFKNIFPLGNKFTILPIIISNYFRWSSIFQKIRADYFISYHNHGVDHIFRNHYLKNLNIKSIHYKHTHAENVFSIFDEGFRPLYSYMNYFLEIHWSKISKEQSIFSNSNSDNFFISGPLWLNQSEREWRNDKLNVIFYPTSHGKPGSINDDNDHIFFLEMALLMTEDDQVNSLFFKPKNSFNSYLSSNNKKLREISKKLLRNKKFIKLNSNDEISKYINEIDMSVHLPFSSSYFNTLFSGIRSFYFDPYNKYPDSIYNQLEGMIYSGKEGFQKALIQNKKMTKRDFEIKFQEISEKFLSIDNFSFDSKSVFHEALNKYI